MMPGPKLLELGDSFLVWYLQNDVITEGEAVTNRTVMDSFGGLAN